MALNADAPGGLDIGRRVVDEQGLGRIEVEPAEQELEDRHVGLGHAFEAGHDGAVEPAQKWKSLFPKRVRLPLHVREPVARDPGRLQGRQEFDGPFDRSGDHLLASSRPRPDELGLVGVRLHERRACLFGRHPEVVRVMPLHRANLGQKAFHRRVVAAEQLPVQVAGVPVEQDAAEVENDRAGPPGAVRGLHQAQ